MRYGDKAVKDRHFMVFTGYNTSGSTFADRYTVYDPAAKTYTTGAGVLLSNTTSGYNNSNFYQHYTLYCI